MVSRRRILVLLSAVAVGPWQPPGLRRFGVGLRWDLKTVRLLAVEKLGPRDMRYDCLERDLVYTYFAWLRFEGFLMLIERYGTEREYPFMPHYCRQKKVWTQPQSRKIKYVVMIHFALGELAWHSNVPVYNPMEHAAIHEAERHNTRLPISRREPVEVAACYASTL